jgi:hypothetical protein
MVMRRASKLRKNQLRLALACEEGGGDVKGIKTSSGSLLQAREMAVT